MSGVGKPPLYKLADSVEKIRKDLERLMSFNKLRVETWTQGDFRDDYEDDEPQRMRHYENVHAETAQDAKEVTVYVTKTGRKYQLGGCEYLRQSKFPIGLQNERTNPMSALSTLISSCTNVEQFKVGGQKTVWKALHGTYGSVVLKSVIY